MPYQPPTLDATVGGPASNSYLDQALAEQILSQYPQSEGIAAWFELTAEQKDQSLIAATLTLDGLDYAGSQCSCEQRLSFPRLIQSCSCSVSSCTTIPFEIQAATALQAAHVGATGGSLFQVGGGGASTGGGGAGLDQFEQVTLGPITVRMKQDASSSDVYGDLRSQIPSLVLNMIQPFLKGGGAAGVYQGINSRQSSAALLQGGGRTAYSGTMRITKGQVAVRPGIGAGWASWQSGTSTGGGRL